MSDFENLELIDWEKSVQLADTDTDLARDILVLTGQSLPTDKLEIGAAFEKGDGREMRRLLHKLEGGISYAKLPRLELATAELHNAVKAETAEQNADEALTQLHQTLQQALTDTIDAINAKIAN